MTKKPYLNSISRRRFLRNSVVAAAGTAILPTFLTSCDDENESFKPEGDFGFFEGVASFDPEVDRVILWTRYTPAANEGNNSQLILDVATDIDFNNLVVSENVSIDINSDYTVNVDMSNLSSNTKYFYRFRNEKSKAVSVTGQTKTLPASGEANNVKMAVVSCANFQAGLFNVYGAVAESDADIVVHLGDYIYEYGEGGYGTNDLTTSLNRVHKPEGEIISVDDYRTRYKQYRSDAQLQKAHQLKPFICVWDDHEITNDAYKNGAENHQSNEGSYETRKINALQVWHEYLPARVTDNSKIYRNFEIGGLLNLIMLDTRIIGREKQLDYAEYFTASGLDTAAFAADWQNPNRTILGSEQLTWVSNQLGSSSAKWQVLGSQVLLGKYFIPVELLLITAQIAAGSATTETFTQYNQVLTELVSIKSRILQGDPSVTSAERARVETVLPYNLDAWDGYPAEREKIFAAASGKKLVGIAGDTHNAWRSSLTDASGNKVGDEFATSSVSSPGFEAIFGSDPATIAGFEQSNQLLIDDLIYADASQRGFILLNISQASIDTEWRYISTLATENTATTIGNTASIS